MRFSVGPDGALRVGPGLPGRGAWLCADSPGCIDQAVRRRALDRALRTTCGITAPTDLARLLDAPTR